MRSVVTNIHSDGTPTHADARSESSEAEVSAWIARRWKCEVKAMGKLCLVDWYAIRDERLMAVMELKTRNHAANTYPTTLLNIRKWLALTMASVGLGVPAIFWVRFTDELRFIRLTDVDATGIRMGGCHARVKSHTDREPQIHVPISAMGRLRP